MRHLIAVLAVLFGAAALAPASFALEAAPGTPMPKTPPRVSGSQCVDCHDAEAKAYAYHGDCASCHAGADAHAKAARPKTVNAGLPESAECLSCHETDRRRMHFTIAEHNKAGIQCADCHGVHSPKVKTLNVAMQRAGKDVALCATCHQDVLARFSMPFHHPVKEGGVSCLSCHDPHAAAQAALVSKTERCTTCHQAVRGPQVFEHPPVVEDCTNCHDPHGSPNRRLLTIAQPIQCLQCHSVASNRHGQTGAVNNTQLIGGAVLRSCTACHGAVHGSSVDQHLRH